LIDMQVSRAHTRCSSADTKLSYSREIQRTKSLTVNVSTMEPPLCMNRQRRTRLEQPNATTMKQEPWEERQLFITCLFSSDAEQSYPSSTIAAFPSLQLLLLLSRYRDGRL